jgi:hypothetical protein
MDKMTRDDLIDNTDMEFGIGDALYVQDTIVCLDRFWKTDKRIIHVIRHVLLRLREQNLQQIILKAGASERCIYLYLYPHLRDVNNKHPLINQLATYIKDALDALDGDEWDVFIYRCLDENPNGKSIFITTAHVPQEHE